MQTGLRIWDLWASRTEELEVIWLKRIRLSMVTTIDASLFFFNLMKVEEQVIQTNYIKDVVG